MLDLELADLRVDVGARCLLSIDQLTLPGGSLLGVSGPSGAGKTTFLNALSGLVQVTGILRWGKTDLSRLSQGERTRFRQENMGMIFQDFLLFEELSALENAAVAASFHQDRGAIRGRAQTLLEGLGLASMLHRRADRLSGGERQRVATARALAHDPAIILADEPTASLDRRAADALMDDLMALARKDGRSVVIVSHDEHVLNRMDQILHLQDGRRQDRRRHDG